MSIVGRENEGNFSTGSEILGQLNYDVLQAHLKDISHLDQQALLATLVPHHHLPSFDPAGYVIQRHTVEPQEHVAVHTTYDLGVVFARSLLERGRPEGALPPAMSPFDESRTRLINEYLSKAAKTPLDVLIRRDDPAWAHVNKATELFAHRCKVIVPHLMLDGKEALLRGAHDYLSVVSLLEAPIDTRRSTFRHMLGKISLADRLRRTAHGQA